MQPIPPWPGRAGTGKTKRRGDSAYYKALAAKRKNPGRKAKPSG